MSTWSHRRLDLRSMLDFEQSSLHEAGDRLASLRSQHRERLLGAVVLAVVAAAALWYLPFEISVGFGAGAVAAVVLAALAFDRRRQLLAELIQRHDAYAIEPVAHAGARFATHARRMRLARWLRDIVGTAEHCEVSASYPTLAIEERVLGQKQRLLALATAFESPEVALHPAGVAIAHRMLTRPGLSALYNPGLPEETLDETLRRIERSIVSPP